MELLQLNPNASVILAGDFNKLNVAEISERTGLLTSVNSPTRGAKILDMIMTSVPQQSESSVRTDYKAILATTKGGVRDRAKNYGRTLVWDTTEVATMASSYILETAAAVAGAAEIAQGRASNTWSLCLLPLK